MTGPAFEYMLQQEDLSVVETVMRNVTVFARMRPGQKGQVMDLLGTRGLHQMHKGQQRTIPVSLLSPVVNSNLMMHAEATAATCPLFSRPLLVVRVKQPQAWRQADASKPAGVD